MTPKSAKPKASASALPYWLPRHPHGDSLPRQLRRAVADILEPLYRGLVLDAPDELQRSAGLTVVHLTWLEMCDQVAMSAQAADPNSLLAVLDDFQQRVQHHLELANAKGRATEMLMRIRAGTQLVRSLHTQFARTAADTLPLAAPSELSPGSQP